jgi:hypothetical protein
VTVFNGQIPNPQDLLALPTKVSSLELNLNSLKSRVDSHDQKLQSHDQTLQTQGGSISTLQSDLSTLKTSLNSLQSQANSIRGLATSEVSLLQWLNGKKSGVDDTVDNFASKADARAKAVVTQDYVRSFVDQNYIKGFVNMDYVHGLISKSWLQGLGFQDQNGVGGAIKNMVPQLVDGSFLSPLINNLYPNLSSYQSKFPKLDTIPTDTTIKGLINQTYVQGFIDLSFLTGKLPGIGDLLNNKTPLLNAAANVQIVSSLKTAASGLNSASSSMNTKASSYISHMSSLTMNLDDWISGGPDGKRPSVTDVGAWANLFTAVKNSMNDLKDFLTAFGDLNKAIAALNSVVTQLKG